MSSILRKEHKCLQSSVKQVPVGKFQIPLCPHNPAEGLVPFQAGTALGCAVQAGRMHSPIPGTNKVPTPSKGARGLKEGSVQLALTKETLRASRLGIQTQEPQD